MIIREAIYKDAKSISELIYEVTEKNPNKYSQEQISAWKKYNTPSKILKQIDDRVIFCAFINNQLVGTVALKENFILGFYINYAIRNKGIGSKLLNYLENYAFENNLKKLQLTATPSAFKFYNKRGYKLKQQVVLSIYNVEYPEMAMEKIISE